MEMVLREEDPRRIPRREAVELTGTVGWMVTNPNHQGLTQASQPTGSGQLAHGRCKEQQSQSSHQRSPGTTHSARKFILRSPEVNLICVSVRVRIEVNKCNSDHKNCLVAREIV